MSISADTNSPAIGRKPSPLPGLGFRLKWMLFRLLESLAVRRTGAPITPVSNPDPPVGHRSGSVWVYVSTIGELNAIEPFLELLLAEITPLPLTLVSDRRVYRESYLRKHPDAYVYEIDGTSEDIERLTALTPPRLFIIAEIPCLLSDAPCRLPFAAIRTAKLNASPVALINGWLYGYPPPSRLDAVERSLFGRDVLKSMDVIAVQTEEVKERLIAEGASADRVHVTGNTKFDALKPRSWTAEGKRSERLLRSIQQSGRPVIVAGCVTDYEDQILILEAFEGVRRRVPSVLLVLVPRHPEQTERLRRLDRYLTSARIPHENRSRLGDIPLPADLSVLVLDTMGELLDFYAVSTVSFVGRDHNILEPMAFGKAVTALPGWEATYPSYPVYRLAMDVGAVHSAQGAEDLCEIWTRLLNGEGAKHESSTSVDFVNASKGAALRNMDLLWSEGILTDKLRGRP